MMNGDTFLLAGSIFGLSEENARREHIDKIGFVRIDPEVIAALVRHGPWLEVGAGTGALASAVKNAGGRVVATDNYKWADGWRGGRTGWVGSFSRVIRADAERAARLIAGKSIGLLMAWPSYNEDWAFRAASKLRPGQALAYLGEGWGGCTADDQLHALLDKSFEEVETVHYPRWAGLHDSLTVYRRMAEVRP